MQCGKKLASASIAVSDLWHICGIAPFGTPCIATSSLSQTGYYKAGKIQKRSFLPSFNKGGRVEHTNGTWSTAWIGMMHSGEYSYQGRIWAMFGWGGQQMFGPGPRMGGHFIFFQTLPLYQRWALVNIGEEFKEIPHNFFFFVPLFEPQQCQHSLTSEGPGISSTSLLKASVCWGLFEPTCPWNAIWKISPWKDVKREKPRLQHSVTFNLGDLRVFLSVQEEKACFDN